MKSIRRVFCVDRREINYIRLTLESYDGMSVVRTIDPHRALIEVFISPQCENMVYELLDNLREHESIRIGPNNTNPNPQART